MAPVVSSAVATPVSSHEFSTYLNDSGAVSAKEAALQLRTNENIAIEVVDTRTA